MQTFRQRMFFAFGLRRNTAARRTPAALQVDRGNVVPIRPAAKPRPAIRFAIEERDGYEYIKVRANRTGAA